MTLKALLFGSAAALIAVSGAQAADAVVAEPEAVDYVKVCDMYGNGFFYIPGTETCLNFNGYVRADFTYNDSDTTTSSTWQYRARFNIDARNETEYGTLRSQLRFQADSDATDGNAVVDRALISLAGFRVGYSDSYTTTHHGYGHQGIEKYDGPYGYDQALFVDYTYAANGFSATAGVQDSTGVAGAPHVNLEYYAGIGYSASMFSVAASYLHEEATDEGSYKVSAIVTPVDGFSIKGWYMADDGATRALGSNALGQDIDNQYGVGVNYQATDTLSVAAAYSDVDNGENAITVGAIWNPVPGLSVRPNAVFREDTGESYSLRIYRLF